MLFCAAGYHSLAEHGFGEVVPGNYWKVIAMWGLYKAMEGAVDAAICLPLDLSGAARSQLGPTLEAHLTHRQPMFAPLEHPSIIRNKDVEAFIAACNCTVEAQATNNLLLSRSAPELTQLFDDSRRPSVELLNMLRRAGVLDIDEDTLGAVAQCPSLPHIPLWIRWRVNVVPHWER